MRIFLLQIFTVFYFIGSAQIGGKSTYQFLNIISSAKTAALGGYSIAIPDADLEMAYFNPALLDTNLSNQIGFDYVNYFSDINYGFAGYAKDYGKLGTFMASVKYIHYGEFIWADETSAILGDFTVSESAYTIGWSKAYKYGLRYGANLKAVYSNFFQYNSFGMLLDFGGVYHKPEKGFMAALVVKNIGRQFTTYTPGNYEPLPFEIQLGMSKRLKHAPFRFSMNMHNLEVLDYYYDSPNNIETTSLFGVDPEENNDNGNIAESIFRHFTAGVELLLTDNFQLRAGYNHQRRSELKLREGAKSGAVGFNFGVGIKIKKFRIDYGRSIYSLAGSTNHLSISTNFSEYISKKDKTD